MYIAESIDRSQSILFYLALTQRMVILTAIAGLKETRKAYRRLYY